MQEKTGFAKQMKFGLLQNGFRIRKQKKLSKHTLYGRSIGTPFHYTNWEFNNIAF